MNRRRGGWLREIIEIILIALVITFVVQTWLFETFVVEGDSMLDTLRDGDRVLVNKFLFNLREPERGDIVVFPYPDQTERELIKRVVAVSGEVVEMQEGDLFINGNRVSEDYLTRRGAETFPPVRVPARSVYVLGDNRENSDDSRLFGPISQDTLTGRTSLVFWPPDAFSVLGGEEFPCLDP